MKTKLLPLLAAVMMLGSAGLASASDLIALDESQMDAVTAGQNTFNFNFYDGACAACVFNFN